MIEEVKRTEFIQVVRRFESKSMYYIDSDHRTEKRFRAADVCPQRQIVTRGGLRASMRHGR
jgi:hypothetical protein